MSEVVEISSPGLNPSNRGAGFPNLARRKNSEGKFENAEEIREVSSTCRAELEAAGIEVSDFKIVWDGEVPTTVRGSLVMWGFKRCWYYWSATGPGLPLEVAEKLHATHGTVVRVDGHCGCPSPKEWFKGFGVGMYHVDSRRVSKLSQTPCCLSTIRVRTRMLRRVWEGRVPKEVSPKEALEAAEKFIEEELECRERSYLPGKNEYISSARLVLRKVRTALAVLRSK